MLQDIKTGIGSGGSGPAGVAVGSLFVPPFVRNITKEVNYPTIQGAIDGANDDNDVIEASQGSYVEDVDFGGKSLILRSSNPNDPAKTVISGVGLYSVPVTMTGNSTLDGFTITNGYYYGIYCEKDSNSTIRNCRIEYNGYSDDNYRSSIFCYNSSATITDTLINNNYGNGIYAYDNSSINVNRCQIANSDWAGIRLSDNSDATITNNIIHNNSHGILLSGCSPSPEIRNNTIVENYEGINTDGDSDPNVNSNIIYYNTTQLNDAFDDANKVKYNCIQGGYGTGNRSDNPEFRDVNNYDYHLTEDSNCINFGNPDFNSLAETDIDGEARVNNSRVDIGADEFYYCSGRVDVFPASPDGIVNFLDFVVIANAWLTESPDEDYNDIADFIDDGVIDYMDLNKFCVCWLYTTANFENSLDGESMMSMPEQEQQSETESIFYSDEEFAESQEEEQSEENQYYYLADYNLPAIYLTCDNNTPDANDEVTIWVHSDYPLFCAGLVIMVSGDANITTAVNEADCNEYGWDNGWNSDPYIDDVNGWAYISGVRWDADANGTVGYVKFRYNSGEVSVYIDQEWSLAFSWDWESEVSSVIPLSQEVILVARDPNEP
jgi:parallel beta-helix repeat protein